MRAFAAVGPASAAGQSLGPVGRAAKGSRRSRFDTRRIWVTGANAGLSLEKVLAGRPDGCTGHWARPP